MELLIEIVAALFLIPGCVLILIGGYGLLRLGDVFERMHAAGMIDTLGLILIIVGLMIHGGFSLISFKLALIIAFVFFTSPLVTHALARAALVDGLVPRARQIELAEPEVNEADGAAAPGEGGSSSKP